MKFELRKATVRDLDEIVKLNKKVADYHRKIDKYYKPSSKVGVDFRKYMAGLIRKKNGLVLVAEADGKMVGYFAAKIEKPSPIFSPKRIGKISRAFVLEEYRRLGIGKMAVKEILKWFRKNKIKHIEISVDARNEIGIRFWKKLGFKEFMKKMRLDL